MNVEPESNYLVSKSNYLMHKNIALEIDMYKTHGPLRELHFP